MTELLFPVVGTLLVFLVGVPSLTLVAWLALRLMAVRTRQVDGHGSELRYALVVAPVAVPLLWLASASVHQSLSGAPIAVCILEHLGSDACRDVVMFGLLLLTVFAAAMLRRLAASARARRRLLPLVSEAADSRRVAAICRATPALAPFASRVRVVDQGLASVCTRGLLRPRIEIEAKLVGELGDDEIRAVLLHELHHARSADPLRHLLGVVTLSLNPAGRLLAPSFARYGFAREAACDRWAVQRGADALTLARCIVLVAGKPHACESAALAGPGIGGVMIRVQLLLGYARRWPGPVGRGAPLGLLTSSALLLLALPHLLGTLPLDLFHYGVEMAARLVGIG